MQYKVEEQKSNPARKFRKSFLALFYLCADIMVELFFQW